MESSENKIKNNIKRQRRGKLLFANDFALCGNIEAVFKALQRLHKSGLIMRVAHGIYYYPKKNMKYGNTPTIDEIAYGIAKRDKIRIVPTGSYALNALAGCFERQLRCRGSICRFPDGGFRTRWRAGGLFPDIMGYFHLISPLWCLKVQRYLSFQHF
jgi:hypothetical protein